MSIDVILGTVYNNLNIKQNNPHNTSNRVARKALTNLKQYTCERYRDVRSNSQEDSLRVATN